jgi:hypothetical protein
VDKKLLLKNRPVRKVDFNEEHNGDEMITLTREEAQDVLELITNAYANSQLAETLRARLAEPEKEQEPRDIDWEDMYHKEKRLREMWTAPPQYAVPESYALVGIDALKAWGVYEQVFEACRYPVAKPEKEQEPVSIKPIPNACAVCWGSGFDITGKPCPFNHGPVKFYTAPPAQQNQFNPDWDAMAVMVEEQQRMAKRIEELEAALREKEPVAWADKYDIDREGHDFWVSRQRPAKYGVPLYAAPFSTPHSAAHSADSAGTFCRREWVGLTEQETGAIMEDLNAYGTRLYEFARAIEAKLKEKNT